MWICRFISIYHVRLLGIFLERVTIDGRGGQGSVTAAELIAVAAFEEGSLPQVFPHLVLNGGEAPVRRLSGLKTK